MNDAHVGLLGLAVVLLLGVACLALWRGTEGCQERADDDSVMEE